MQSTCIPFKNFPGYPYRCKEIRKVENKTYYIANADSHIKGMDEIKWVFKYHLPQILWGRSLSWAHPGEVFSVPHGVLGLALISGTSVGIAGITGMDFSLHLACHLLSGWFELITW